MLMTRFNNSRSRMQKGHPFLGCLLHAFRTPIDDTGPNWGKGAGFSGESSLSSSACIFRPLQLAAGSRQLTEPRSNTSSTNTIKKKLAICRSNPQMSWLLMLNLYFITKINVLAITNNSNSPVVDVRQLFFSSILFTQSDNH